MLPLSKEFCFSRLCFLGKIQERVKLESFQGNEGMYLELNTIQCDHHSSSNISSFSILDSYLESFLLEIKWRVTSAPGSGRVPYQREKLGQKLPKGAKKPVSWEQRKTVLEWPLNNNHMNRAKELSINVITTLVQRKKPQWEKGHH